MGILNHVKGAEIHGCRITVNYKVTNNELKKPKLCPNSGIVLDTCRQLLVFLRATSVFKATLEVLPLLVTFILLLSLLPLLLISILII